MKEQLRVHIGGTNRYSGQLNSSEAGFSLSEIAAQIITSNILLWGGEPTLRSDLPALLTLCQQKGALRISMRTDALLFMKVGMAAVLKNSGLTGIYVTFPSARGDACEWLLGKGIMAKGIRGIRNAIEEGLEVIADIPLTRSTIDHLGETIAIAHRLGITKVLLRRLEFGENEDKLVLLTPRFGLLELPLTAAIRKANSLGVEVAIEGVPDCILGDHREYRIVFKEGREKQQFSCVSCTPSCCMISAEYLEHFGWSEIWDVQPEEEPTSLALHFSATESTRSIRQRLMLAAQTLPKELRLLGDFSHPEMYSLLREALRLSIPKIALVGDLIPLRRLSALEVLRLRNVTMLAHRVTDTRVAPEVIELFDRWKGPIHRLYVLVEKPEDVLFYDQLFIEEELPMAPFFRVVGSGQIEDFSALLPQLSEQSAANLTEILPHCLHHQRQEERRDDWMKYRMLDKEMSNLDLFPRFQACSHSKTCQQAQCCVGLMEGYTATTIKAITTDDQ